jgi:hypothetical protein
MGPPGPGWLRAGPRRRPRRGAAAGELQSRMHAWAAHSARGSASLLLFLCLPQHLPRVPPRPTIVLCICITPPSPRPKPPCLQLSSQLEELGGADAVQQLLDQLDGEWQHLRRLRQKYGSSSLAVAAAAGVAIAPAATGGAPVGSLPEHWQVSAARTINSCNTGGQQVAARGL